MYIDILYYWYGSHCHYHVFGSMDCDLFRGPVAGKADGMLGWLIPVGAHVSCGCRKPKDPSGTVQGLGNRNQGTSFLEFVIAHIRNKNCTADSETKELMTTYTFHTCFNSLSNKLPTRKVPNLAGTVPWPWPLNHFWRWMWRDMFCLINELV